MQNFCREYYFLVIFSENDSYNTDLDGDAWTDCRILGKFLGLIEFFPYTDPDNSLR